MRKVLTTLMAFVIGLSVYAAKPIEVTVDSITYRLNLASNTFTVFKAGLNLQIANICDSVEYEGILYPVTAIARAFSDDVTYGDNYALKMINIPNTVKEIGPYAFTSCVNLESISLPDSLVSIGERALSWCYSLKEIKFPTTLEYIGPYAFGNDKLEKIFFDTGNIKVDYSAFDDCFDVKEVYASSLEDWLSLNFCGHGYYDEVNPLSASHANLYVNNELVENLIIPEGRVQINESSFNKCGSLISVQIPNSIEFIGPGAFYNCLNLTELDFGSGLKAIYNYAFALCPNLEIIRIHALEPPALENAFRDSYPEYMTLHIPEGTRDVYENANGWKDFGFIIDDLPNDSGVKDVDVEMAYPTEIFNINGVCVFTGIGDCQLPSGVYIIRQRGKSKKIVIQ